jgi:hypothetical protein
VAFGDQREWATPAWRAAATAWLDEQLAVAGAVRTGDVEQPRLRPWSTLLRAPTSHGPVWLKAGGRRTGYEAGLYEVLAELAPERVLVPLAVDAARGWVLLPDGGPPVGERLVDALPRYAELQRALAAAVARLVALGVPDMRPAVMPERFEEALAATAPSDLHPRLEALRPQAAAWCRRLGESAVPASIDHNDLHGHNVLSGPRFYDWGDSVVAHPFASMLLPLSMAAPEDRAGLRDAYLEPWRDLGTHAELEATLELACRVGTIARALTWVRAAGADPAWAAAPLATLAELL